MEIRLKQDWQDGRGYKFPAGQVFSAASAEEIENAKRLIDSGVAEVYEPQKGDIVAPSAVPAPVGLSPMRKEDIKDIVKEITAEMFKETSRFQQNVVGGKEAEYEKTGGYKLFSEFARDVFRASIGQTPSEKFIQWQKFAAAREKASGMNESVGSDGGYLVPTEFRNQLLGNIEQESVFLSRVNRVPMMTNSVEFPIIDESTRASSFFGGIVVYRVADGASITASKPKIGRVRLTLNKVAALCYATNELLEDSPISIEPTLTRMFASALAMQIDDDIINGTGAGQPLGIVNAPCTVTLSKESGQTNYTINAANIVKMWSRLFPSSQGRAIWVANPDTRPQLAELRLPSGSGVVPAGIYQPATNYLAGRAIDTLCGAPLFYSEFCQPLGTSGDIILLDPSMYLFGQKAAGDMQMATSIHIKFVEDETAFRATLRYDGRPQLKSALTPKYGSNTLSGFIKLEARTS